VDVVFNFIKLYPVSNDILLQSKKPSLASEGSHTSGPARSDFWWSLPASDTRPMIATYGTGNDMARESWCKPGYEKHSCLYKKIGSVSAA
jgi:hypothetical protein